MGNGQAELQTDLFLTNLFIVPGVGRCVFVMKLRSPSHYFKDAICKLILMVLKKIDVMRERDGLNRLIPEERLEAVSVYTCYS